MYTRQDKNQMKIGYGGYGNFGALGQVPTQTVNFTDPMDGSKITATGPVTETAQATALFGLISGAAGAAKQGNLDQARQVMINARGLLPSVGSLQPTFAPVLAKLDQFIASKSATPNVSINITSGKSNTMLYAVIGGVVLLGALVLLKKK